MSEALAASILAEMVGAVALARAAGEEEQRSAILRASRDQLKQRFGITERRICSHIFRSGERKALQTIPRNG